MIGLGAINGARFYGTSFRVLLQYAGAALGSFAVALLVAAVFIAAAAFALALPVPNLVAAYAPGSVDVMMILALAMHLDRYSSARITSRASCPYRLPCRCWRG